MATKRKSSDGLSGHKLKKLKQSQVIVLTFFHLPLSNGPFFFLGNESAFCQASQDIGYSICTRRERRKIGI